MSAREKCEKMPQKVFGHNWEATLKVISFLQLGYQGNFQNNYRSKKNKSLQSCVFMAKWGCWLLV